LLDSFAARPYLIRMVLLRKRTRPGLGFVEPCLPSSAKVPPSGPGWIHEIKHDGFRIMARRDGAGVRLFTRRGHASMQSQLQKPSGYPGRSRRHLARDRAVRPRAASVKIITFRSIADSAAQLPWKNIVKL
jgi:hypothetical protein